MKQILLFFLFIGLTKASIWANLTANIAVIEFQTYREKNATSQELIDKNLEGYINIFQEIEKNQTKLDLIVFPELSLAVNPETSTKLSLNSTPCTSGNAEDPEYLKILSCLAIQYDTYLVTNLVEKSECNPENSTNKNCQTFGFYFYNTDIVFDRKGTIINIYRKYNLFGEWQLDMPSEPDIETFETDFGVTFGIFTCFDILFKSPAEDVAALPIDGLIYPTYWHSELPFMTALQAQQMWAYAHKTLVFAAGGNRPVDVSGGSGIYDGTMGTFATSFVASGGSKILLYKSVNGEVTPETPRNIDELSSEMDAFPLIADDSLKNYTFKIMNTSKSEIQEKICHKNTETEEDFCCDFDVKLSKTSEPEGNFYTYFFLAFSGVRVYSNITTAGGESCSIVACLNSSIASCGFRFPKYEEVSWPLTFEEIKIKADFDVSNDKRQFPNSLLSSIRPIDASETEFGTKILQDEEEKMEVTFNTTRPQNRVLTFAIYGRNFAKDSFPDRDRKVTQNGMENVKCFLMFLVLLIFAVFIM